MKKKYLIHVIALFFSGLSFLNSQTDDTIIDSLSTQKKNKKPLTIVGNGKQTRDFIHVDDLTNAFIKLAKSGLKNKIYNLGSGKETSINKIASIIGGKKTFIPKRPGDPSRSCANILKIKKDINWKPKISIKQGIKRLFLN